MGRVASARPTRKKRHPIRALGGMERRQRDALDGRRVAGVGTHPQFGDQCGQVEIRSDGDLFVDEFGQRRQCLPAFRALTPAGVSAVRPSGSGDCGQHREAPR